MRPFEMQPGEARHLLARRLDAGRDHSPGDLGGIRDQRRQTRSAAEGRMRPADRLDSLDIRMIVEHDAAAAIDLRVDEAGGKHVAVLDYLRAGRNLVPRADSFYRITANDERGILMPGFAVEDALG